MNMSHEIGALVFAGALGFLLKESEGIAITPKNDILKSIPQDMKSVLVWKSNGKIRIQATNEAYEDGQMIWMHDDEEIDT